MLIASAKMLADRTDVDDEAEDEGKLSRGLQSKENDQHSELNDAAQFLRNLRKWKSEIRKPSGVNQDKLRIQFLEKGRSIQNSLSLLEEKTKSRSTENGIKYESFFPEATRLLRALKLALRKAKQQEINLKVYLDKLKRTLKKKSERENNLKKAIIRLEEERRQAFGSISQPHWEIPHHFHMIALEHFRGNKQKQLADIAELFPGHLRIAAMAKQTSLLPSRMLPKFKDTQLARKTSTKEIDELEKRIQNSSADKEVLEECVTLIESCFGLLKKKENSEKVPAHQSNSTADVSRATRFPSSNHGGYINIKRKYFQALNLRSGSLRANNPSGDHCPAEETFLCPKMLNLSDFHLKAVKESSNIPSSKMKKICVDFIAKFHELKKDRKKIKEILERIRVVRGTFDAEMAQLRLLRLK